MWILNDGVNCITFKTRNALSEHLTRYHSLPGNESNKALAVLNGKYDGYKHKLVINGTGYEITVKRRTK